MVSFGLSEADPIPTFTKNMFIFPIPILIMTLSFKYLFLDKSFMHKDVLLTKMFFNKYTFNHNEVSST